VTRCPCSSGLAYAACCKPFHDGRAEAPTPEALMRSRYAAFSLGVGEYLARTLHASHPDAAAPRDELARALRDAARRMKYPELVILDRRDPGPDGVALVLFYARVFEKGKSRSFVERSEFRHDGVGWRYADGTLVPEAELGSDPRTLDLTAFEARLSSAER
jgi:SEC-C motif-containing protein